MNTSNGNRSWTEYFRLLTPVLLFVLTMVASSATTKLNDLKIQLAALDDKIFKHLTNDELHCPKSVVVTRIEYDHHVKEGQRLVDRVYAELTAVRQALERLQYGRSE